MNTIRFGERVKFFRQRAGMTQAELSEKIGKTPHHITQIERGISLPSVPLLYDISQVLGVPIDCFFMDSDRMYATYSALRGVDLLQTYNSEELARVAQIVESIRGLLNDQPEQPELWEKKEK